MSEQNELCANIEEGMKTFVRLVLYIRLTLCRVMSRQLYNIYSYTYIILHRVILDLYRYYYIIII